LGLEKTATAAEIKKAYYKLSLQYHPDKLQGDNIDKDEASAMFIQVKRIYEILSDEEKRKIYDETGEYHEDDDLDFEAMPEDTLAHLTRFFRAVYKAINEEDIRSFKEKYQGSEEERQDIKKYYLQFGGKMDQVMEWVLLAEESEEKRFMNIVNELIAAEELPELAVFTSWAQKIAKKKVRKAAAPSSGTLKENQPLQLTKSKTKRQNEYDAMVAAMEAKYAGKAVATGSGKGRGKGSAKKAKTSMLPPEPSEAEFQAIQARLLKK
jgi:DnaJ homolog subfamily C member 9